MQETPYKTRASSLGVNRLETDKENETSNFLASPIKKVYNETPTRVPKPTHSTNVKEEHKPSLAGPEVPVASSGITRSGETRPTMPKVPEKLPERRYVPQKPSSVESNLLLNKVKAQSEEIDQLKSYIKQLKQENTLLQQDNYSKLQTINDNKRRSAQEMKVVTDHFEDMVSQEQEHQAKLSEQVNTLKNETASMRSSLDRKQSEITVLKEVLKTVNKELSLMKSEEYTDIVKLNNFQLYSKIMKKFVQENIVNKLADDFDKLGILLDQQMDTELVQHFDNRFEDLSEENTTDLINFNRDNTTDVLLKHKNYISIEKLIINSIKPPKDAKTRLRIYIRFIMCVNRFKSK